jgi:hypothetical protein
MTPVLASVISAMTYVAAALFAYGIVLYLMRRKIHDSNSRLPPHRQQHLLAAWRRLLGVTRVYVIVLPVCLVAVIVLLSAFASIPIALTAPLCGLMYLNLLIIHIDRGWHAKALSETSEASSGGRAA